MKTLIKNATIVNEGETYEGSIIIEGDLISEISTDKPQPTASFDEIVDAAGCYVLPGVIDEHVHFREPGMTHKADIESETRAAAAGGVTSFFDMPNTNPQTTTIRALEDKYVLASTKSHVNYGFFIGATNDNIDELLKVDPRTVPGVKLFMGSSTGNMLVDQEEALEEIFSRVKLPIMTHCEDTAVINNNMAIAKEKYGEDPDVIHHPEIRDVKACINSSTTATELALRHNARLHIAHLSSGIEAAAIEQISNHSPLITAEICIGHLLFSDEDYARKGTLIKVNPSIKSKSEQKALNMYAAKTNGSGLVTTIATDHAPHLLNEKQGGCAKAASGMPMIQFSLPTMMELVEKGEMGIERLVELMCHNPANTFSVDKRGFLRKGYKADITIVKHEPWTVTNDCILSKCGWSPLEGERLSWQVVRTICNGHTVYQDGKVDVDYIGERLTFRN